MKTLPDWAGVALGLLGIGGGALLLFFPYHIIRAIAKLMRAYYRGLYQASDQMLDARLPLPWSRYLQDGLSYSVFLREAEDHPRRFTAWSGCIRLVGGGIALMSGGALLLVLLLHLAGFIE